MLLKHWPKCPSCGGYPTYQVHGEVVYPCRDNCLYDSEMKLDNYEGILNFWENYIDSDIRDVETTKGEAKWIWITINPKPDVDPHTFVELVGEYFTRSKYILENNLRYVYVFETRVETVVDVNANNIGLHVHGLIESPPEKRHRDNFVTILRKKLLSKGIIGNGQHVYAKSIPNSLFKQKVRYMTGHKKDLDKVAKLEVQGEILKKLGIPQIVYPAGFDYKNLKF